jgi:hypothetical protein
MSIAVIAVIAVVAFAQIFSEIQNPKIFCYAWESGTSDWYKSEGYPVISSYRAGAENASSLPNVNLRVLILK